MMKKQRRLFWLWVIEKAARHYDDLAECRGWIGHVASEDGPMTREEATSRKFHMALSDMIHFTHYGD